jgi:hypothetical protein
MLPALSLHGTPPDGYAFVGVSYLPTDFLAYTAFIRQAAEHGSLLLYNPFTTEPQAPRFLLLFHWLVGLGARATGLSAVDAFEWSRVPLVFLFFATLWWFLRPLLPDRKDRLAGAVLVGFAGGLEGWVRPFAGALPADLAARLLGETSGLMGWSVFACFYNPLWTAALSLAMAVLRPLLFSPRPSALALASASATFVLLFYTHPYTAVGVLAIAGAGFAAALLGRRPLDLYKPLAAGAALAPALLAIAGVSFWQMQDPVYRVSSGGVFGPQNVSVLWYPLTLGLLGVLAVAGARRWIASGHPFRFELLGWIPTVALLHWLPFVNGYKFVFLLPLPLCVLAAPVARELLGGPRRGIALAAGLALFGGVVFQTLEGLQATREGVLPSPAMELVSALATRPAGNALVPPAIGNVLPTYSPHRVWIGHWFLTPDMDARQEIYKRILNDPRAAPVVRRLYLEQRLRYLAVPREHAGRMARALDGSVVERFRFGGLELLVLDEPQTRAGPE